MLAQTRGQWWLILTSTSLRMCDAVEIQDGPRHGMKIMGRFLEEVPFKEGFEGKGKCEYEDNSLQ